MKTLALTEVQLQNHEMIVKLHSQYQYDRIVAIREASKIQRDLSKVEHEIHRLDNHLERIEAFCTKNNITLAREQ